MDELVAVHPYSLPGPFTVSPDGDHVFAAEGGSVALLHGDHVNTSPWSTGLQSDYETPEWRVPVGSMGVTPIDMVLDPDWGDEVSPVKLLYIAAGRDGLWVMEADKNNPTPMSFRVDDSGDPNPATQYGRKWCNAVQILNIGGDQYVMALFAGRGRSNLRVYRLDNIRNVATTATAETGFEIGPNLRVILQHNPNVIAMNPGADAYAFGMDVHERVGPPGVEVNFADVYIAMGEHGIYRTQLKYIPGLPPQPGDLVLATGAQKDPGPWFGAGSAYATSVDSTLYGRVQYFEWPAGTQESFSHCPYFLDVAVDDRIPGAHRLYAAVDHLGWVAFSLEAPWSEFIYDSSSSTGFPDFIQAGRRVQIKEPQGPPPSLGGPGALQSNWQIRLIEDSSLSEDKRQSSARHVQVVETVDAQSQEVFSTLVVSASSRRFVYDPGRRNEGRVLLADLNLGPVPTNDYAVNANGKNDWVVAWDLRGVGDVGAGWINNGYNRKAATVGGWDLHALESQPGGELQVLFGSDVDYNRLYEPGQKVERQNLTRVKFAPWPPPSGANLPVNHVDFVTRGRFFRQGRAVFEVAPSKLDPHVLVSSENDGGLGPDSPLLFDGVAGTITPSNPTGGWTTETPDPITVKSGNPVPAGQDNWLTYGVTMDPKGGFVGQDGADLFEYRMGYEARNIKDLSINSGDDDVFGYRWRADKWRYIPGGVPPFERPKELYFTPPANKFSVAPYEMELDQDKRLNWSGRAFYNVMATFEDYNQYVASNWPVDVDPSGLMFAEVNGSLQGIWALRLSKLKGVLDNTSASNQKLLYPSHYAPGGLAANLVQGALVTHPEYWNVDDVRTGSAHSDAEYFINNADDHFSADVQNWHPDLFQLPLTGTTNPPPMGWALAVPCGYVALSTQNGILQNHSPQWNPDQEFIAGHRHMMVRIFDVTDPTLISSPQSTGAGQPNLDSATLPALTIIGPEAETSSYIVRHWTTEDPLGATHYFLFVGDLSGRLYLYDISDVLGLMATSTVPGQGKHYGWFFADPPVATYQTQQSLSDAHTHGVYGLEVVDEVWGTPPNESEATYVYLGVPRIGIEVLKVGWVDTSQSGSPANWVADLGMLDAGNGYIGRIQTPGDATYVHVQAIDGTPYLFLGDYGGGIRVYQHPATGQ